MKGQARFITKRKLGTMTFLFIFLLIYTISSFAVQTQNVKYSSKKKKSQELIKTIKTELVLQNQIDALESDGDQITQGLLLVELGKRFLLEKKISLADSTTHKALSLFNENDCNPGKADCYFLLGRIAIKQKTQTSVLTSFSKSAYHYKLENNYTGAIYSYIQLANYFSRVDNIEFSEKYYNLSMELLKDANDISLKEMVYLNIANHYTKKKEYDIALKYYHELEIFTANKKRINKVYNNLGVLHLRNKNWNKAEYYLLKSLEIKKTTKDSVGIINTTQNLFRVSVKQNQLIRAQKYYLDLKSSFNKKIEANDAYLDFVFNCIQYHYLNNSPKLANEALQEYYTAKDSLSNLAFSDKLIEMQKSFEMQEKDREIELLQKEDALQKAQLNNQKLFTLSVSVLALLLIGIGVLVNRQRRRLKKAQHILKQRKQEIILVNEELQRTNLSKDRILAVIGHDLRGPVGGLKELIELYMELGEFEPEDFHNLLSAARESSTSTYHLLENLLSWANSQRGQIMFEPETTLIKDMICHTVELLDKAVNTRGIRFKCDVPEGLQLTVDKNMLNTIVRNLVSNAIKFSPEKSLITITATEQAEEVILCIADEGIGFSAKESENLFTHKEAYFLENGNSAKGTGLGLILCKEFVERHGGRIWTESDLKKGAKVCFSIPKELQELTPMEEAPVKKSRKKWRAWSNLF